VACEERKRPVGDYYNFDWLKSYFSALFPSSFSAMKFLDCSVTVVVVVVVVVSDRNGITP